MGVRTIQLAGYDVYYEEKSPQTRQRFIKNLRKACDWAEEAQVVLAIEIMDDPFINSIEKYLAVEKRLTLPTSLYTQILVMYLPGIMMSTVNFILGIMPSQLSISRILMQ